MNRRLMMALVVVLISAGVVVYARGAREAQPQVRVVESAAADKVTLACRNCQAGFTLAEAKPMPGRNAFVVCPKCGKPTPLATAKGHPASK